MKLEEVFWWWKTNRVLPSVPTIVLPDGSILVEPTDAELEKKISG